MQEQIEETQKQMLGDNRIAQIDCRVMPKIAEVRHPINSECKLNKLVTYCYNCGANVKGQKFCHGCGYKLDWESLKNQKEE